MRAEHVDPPIPEEITERDLDQKARFELKTLSKDNSEFVAKHLAMASILIDSDPELAHQHALSASRRGGRIAMVRESLAITAYTTGDYALALRELRTYRRISGRDDQLPLMVDCERGLGRPDRALELGRSIDREKLPTDQRVQLAIAMSGARLDQGQTELALAELEIPQLDRTRAFDYSPALFTAYATVLDDLGQKEEAALWHSAAKRAEAALQAVSHNEFETIEIVTEDVELDEDEIIDGDPVEGELVESEIKEERSDFAEDEDAERDEKRNVTETAAAVTAATLLPTATDNIQAENSSESIDEQIKSEYEEILAEVEAAADAAAAEADTGSDTESDTAAIEEETIVDEVAEDTVAEDTAAEDEPAAIQAHEPIADESPEVDPFAEEPFELSVLSEDTLEPIEPLNAPAVSAEVSEDGDTVKNDSGDDPDSEPNDDDSQPSLFDI
ncbi:MAG: hypothetical protein ACTHXA_08000 [Gulosibacter sp.]|uniref:hypothetical protein n=1 Tax=Gulosibacter sp. TaxID=2817531 RepID=UPI003F901117